MTLMRRSTLILAAVCFAGALAVFIAATRTATGIYMAETRERAVASLGLTIQALDGHLRRFEAVPDLLADQERVLRLVEPDRCHARAGDERLASGAKHHAGIVGYLYHDATWRDDCGTQPPSS